MRYVILIVTRSLKFVHLILPIVKSYISRRRGKSLRFSIFNVSDTVVCDTLQLPIVNWNVVSLCVWLCYAIQNYVRFISFDANCGDEPFPSPQCFYSIRFYGFIHFSSDIFSPYKPTYAFKLDYIVRHCHRWLDEILIFLCFVFASIHEHFIDYFSLFSLEWVAKLVRLFICCTAPIYPIPNCRSKCHCP